MGLNETQLKAVEKHFNMLDELDAIIEEDNYSWIKVKRLSDNATFQELEDHHRKETEFLIAKCRELAGKLKQSIDGKTFQIL